jgi:hypothetical protein
MFEVYTGSKPGRRSALLIATALLLVGTIVLAWWQVHVARGLGSPIAIPGTPLRVRLPVQWKQDKRNPNSFVLPTRGDSAGQQNVDYERRISFVYERGAGFKPPVELLSNLPNITEAQAGRIGPFDAVQVRRQERRRWGVMQSIVRLAVLPNGDRVSVIYLPMSALTNADLELLDAVCQAVQFDDPKLTVGWAEACRQTGIELKAEPGWRAVLPALSEVPGFFAGGALQRVPAWSLGVFRTWLVAGRAPDDLLSDFAAGYWLLPEAKVTHPDWKRADGAAVALIRHPDASRNRQPIAAAVVVAESPAEAVIAFLYTDERFLKPALEVTEQIARTINILPTESIPQIETAEQAGREFAAKLAAAGAVPWWGELPVHLEYRGSTSRGDESMSIRREPSGRDPVRGYRGSSIVAVGNRYQEALRWEVGRSGRYDFKTQKYGSDGQAIEVHETRSARDEPVTRVRTLNDSETRYSFEPGPAFVSPPLESLAESWAARESHSPVIEERSSLFGAGTHACLLRPLSPNDGYARVLVQEDFWPFGEIVGFDEAGEVQFRRSATGQYRRVSDKEP